MNCKFEYLHEIDYDIERTFDEFYDRLFHDKHFKNFFDNEKLIRKVIDIQITNFKASLQDDEDELMKRYVYLGELHHVLKIPYVDFIKGIDILEEHLFDYIQSKDAHKMLMGELLVFFKKIKSYIAKGYLNKMIALDKKDIHIFLQNIQKNSELGIELVLERIHWLDELLNAIQREQQVDLNDTDSRFNQWLKSAVYIEPDQKEFLDSLNKRIYINANHIFYYLEKKSYLEILPLYSSLMSIYKLTLLLSNSVSIAMTEFIKNQLEKDELMHLYRKRAFEKVLSKEISTLKVVNNPFSLIFIDIDHFKGVNDTYGHLAGDMVLAHMGEVINKNLRSSDMGFRIGGDEVSLILKGANIKQAKIVCDRLKDEFTTHEFDIDGNKFFVTISIGIVEYHKDNIQGIEIRDAIKAVDTKLYESKNSGRDKISH
jgi:diguanylate cyclase (GGDEF)-like protein